MIAMYGQSSHPATDKIYQGLVREMERRQSGEDETDGPITHPRKPKTPPPAKPPKKTEKGEANKDKKGTKLLF